MSSERPSEPDLLQLDLFCIRMGYERNILQYMHNQVDGKSIG